ncbi:hypothetical protein GNF80_16755 [Clostridium perfringens]|nr:hypothetical protein [Clostridium perfringens]
MANTVETAIKIQNTLDKAAQQQLLTGWMEPNSTQVIYNGGKEVKIPKLTVDGLGNYSRADGTGTKGYVAGSASFSYETKTMTQDRGRKFEIDAMDVDESNYSFTIANVMGEFQRMHVIPEIDAYRLSKLASIAIAKKKDTNVVYGYTPNKDDIISNLKDGIKKIREKGYNGDLVIHLTYDAMTELELAMLNKISSVDFSVNGVNTKVPAIDRIPLIETPQNRMYTAIKLNDGVTGGQEAGGYVKASNAKDINFIICPRKVPIAISKQDKMKIFEPKDNQDADAWKAAYRRYHDLWVKDNSEDSIFVNIKDAK